MLLNASARIKAYRNLEAMSITKGENVDKKSGALFLRRMQRDLQAAKRPKSLGTKDGRTLWSFLTPYHDPAFMLVEGHSLDGKPIGGLLTTNLGKIDTVFVDPAFRGKGLGTVLYLGAIHELGSIRSSTYIGTMAVATWKAISKYYHVRLERLGSGKPVPVPFEWGSDGIPVVDGKPITKLKDSFIFRVTK